MTEKNKPKQNIRIGACNVAVWSNIREVNKEDVEFLSAQISRSYKDKNDEWKTTDSFGVSDVPKIILALQKAYDYMVTNKDDEEK